MFLYQYFKLIIENKHTRAGVKCFGIFFGGDWFTETQDTTVPLPLPKGWEQWLQAGREVLETGFFGLPLPKFRD